MLIRLSFSKRALIVAATAILMAYISAKFLFNGSVTNTIPWGILALATSLGAVSKKEALKLGAVFGFVVSYSFLWFDNTDAKSFANVLFLIALVTLPALFGAACGLLVSWLGWQLRPTGKKRPQA